MPHVTPPGNLVPHRMTNHSMRHAVLRDRMPNDFAMCDRMRLVMNHPMPRVPNHMMDPVTLTPRRRGVLLRCAFPRSREYKGRQCQR
jgi:hypothetical protein